MPISGMQQWVLVRQAVKQLLECRRLTILRQAALLVNVQRLRLLVQMTGDQPHSRYLGESCSIFNAKFACCSRLACCCNLTVL